MIKIAYFEKGIRQERGYPVLFFQLQKNDNDGFLHLKGIIEKFCNEEGLFDFSARADIYELVNIDKVIFESKKGSNILSNYSNNVFTTSLDSKYWKIFLKLINIIVKDGTTGHVYSDDSIMSSIWKELDDPVTMIFDRDSIFVDIEWILEKDKNESLKYEKDSR